MVHILPGRPAGKPDQMSPIHAAVPPAWCVAVGDTLLHGVDAVADYSGKSNVLRTCARAAPVRQRASGDVEVLGELGRGEELRHLLTGSLCPLHGAIQSPWAPSAALIYCLWAS